jgi:polysaccharide export outer membrane protein
MFGALCGAAGLCFGAVPGFAVVPAQAQADLAQAGGGPATGAHKQYEAYRINPGDELEIYVWGEERLQRSVKVLPDGTFAFPLVGQLDAAGKLPIEIAADITRGLKAQYRDNVPTVTVSVKAAVGLQFSVAGKVKSPGAFTPGRYVNVMEALVMAGGPAEFADVDGVTILRKTDGGHLTSFKVHLSSIFKGNPSARDMSSLPELQSGDTVIVP